MIYDMIHVCAEWIALLILAYHTLMINIDAGPEIDCFFNVEFD